MLRTDINATKIRLRADSIAEVAAFAEQRIKAPDDGRANDSREHGTDWNGGLTFQQAIDIGKAGGRWEEGVKGMKESVASMTPTLPKPRIHYRADYAGSRPSVPRYLAGAPRHMIRQVRELDKPRTLKIGVSLFICASFDREESINRGASILAAIQALEDDGTRVELVGLLASDEWTDIQVSLKSAGEFMSPADLAFPLCHPAFFRRIMFATLEMHANAIDMISRNHYGNSRYVEANPPEGFDAVIGLTTPEHADTFNNPEAGRQLVLDTINEQAQEQAA